MYCSIMPKLKHSFTLNAKQSLLFVGANAEYTKAMLKPQNNQEEKYGSGVGKRIKEALDSIQRGGRGPLLEKCVNREGEKGISPQAPNGWVKNGRISTYNLSVLSEFTKFRLEYLIHGKLPKRIDDKIVMEQPATAGDNDQSIKSAVGSYVLAPAKEIPLLTPNQATQWMEALNSGDYKRMPYPIQDEITVTATMFYVAVSGDANYPEIKHGEIALIDPERTPENENFVLAEIGGDVSIRQCIRDAGDWWLIAKNANYPPKPMGSANIIGVVLFSHDPPSIKYHV